MTISKSMKAVVFHDKYDIRTEIKDVPKIQNENDAILKVSYSGVCGTDLHSYRGHIKGPTGTIIGHEFLGEIVEIGSNVTKFKVGDSVLSNFTIQCGECWYCKHGYSGQCVITNTFGKIGLDGGQAEYVRVPYAENTLIKKPENKGSESEVDDSIYLLMADIFVTGYYGVKKIIDFLSINPTATIKAQDFSKSTILQIGAGPVGLCATRVLKHFGFKNIVVVDSVPSRLNEAIKFGATKVINFETESNELSRYIEQETNGIGFDAVLEAVGASSAQRTAFDSVRRNGLISSLGMGHTDLPFTSLDCYLKNVNISFGRCHAASLFHESLEIFEHVKNDFKDFIDYKTSIDNSKEAFDLFDKHKVNKVIFDLTK
ncbi:unnamed protein product [Candida verbasci]|uniref:Alcohol dehydrogenase n=1 Tax=Candida verbasci TaxID=1227364 RepID=A0A9W4XA94_9ASCO|nr:unnamed protein product [Candida verbasci]